MTLQNILTLQNLLMNSVNYEERMNSKFIFLSLLLIFSNICYTQDTDTAIKQPAIRNLRNYKGYIYKIEIEKGNDKISVFNAFKVKGYPGLFTSLHGMIFDKNYEYSPVNIYSSCYSAPKRGKTIEIKKIWPEYDVVYIEIKGEKLNNKGFSPLKLIDEKYTVEKNKKEMALILPENLYHLACKKKNITEDPSHVSIELNGDILQVKDIVRNSNDDILTDCLDSLKIPDENAFLLSYEKKDTNTKGSSGSPFFDSAGKVYAMFNYRIDDYQLAVVFDPNRMKEIDKLSPDEKKTINNFMKHYDSCTQMLNSSEKMSSKQEDKTPPYTNKEIQALTNDRIPVLNKPLKNKILKAIPKVYKHFKESRGESKSEFQRSFDEISANINKKDVVHSLLRNEYPINMAFFHALKIYVNHESYKKERYEKELKLARDTLIYKFNNIDCSFKERKDWDSQNLDLLNEIKTFLKYTKIPDLNEQCRLLHTKGDALRNIKNRSIENVDSAIYYYTIAQKECIENIYTGKPVDEKFDSDKASQKITSLAREKWPTYQKYIRIADSLYQIENYNCAIKYYKESKRWFDTDYTYIDEQIKKSHKKLGEEKKHFILEELKEDIKTLIERDVLYNISNDIPQLNLEIPKINLQPDKNQLQLFLNINSPDLSNSNNLAMSLIYSHYPIGSYYNAGAINKAQLLKKVLLEIKEKYGDFIDFESGDSKIQYVGNADAIPYRGKLKFDRRHFKENINKSIIYDKTDEEKTNGKLFFKIKKYDANRGLAYLRAKVINEILESSHVIPKEQHDIRTNVYKNKKGGRFRSIQIKFYLQLKEDVQKGKPSESNCDM